MISRKLIEIMLMKHGIGYDSIKQMTEKEVMEYVVIIQELDMIEAEKMESMRR
jgi:hypothetical protein